MNPKCPAGCTAGPVDTAAYRQHTDIDGTAEHLLAVACRDCSSPVALETYGEMGDPARIVRDDPSRAHPQVTDGLRTAAWRRWLASDATVSYLTRHRRATAWAERHPDEHLQALACVRG